MSEITRDEFAGRVSNCDERFKRDKERLDKEESQLDRLAMLVTEVTGIVNANAKAIADQETRLRAIEGKGGQWLDKLLMAGAGGLLGYLLSMLFPT